MNDRTFPQFVTDNIQTIRRIAGILSFENAYVPAASFSKAFAAVGADVASDVLFRVAEQQGYEGTLGIVRDIRADFGIALFLVTIAEAPQQSPLGSTLPKWEQKAPLRFPTPLAFHD